MTESAGAVISEMRAQRDRAMARIAELEAERNWFKEAGRKAIDTLGELGKEIDQWKARAERAEAELAVLRSWPYGHETCRKRIEKAEAEVVGLKTDHAEAVAEVERLRVKLNESLSLLREQDRRA